jgi:hypothetical protein
MPKPERGLLDVLKSELSFLERGGYRRSVSKPWRAPLIFEDSPTCGAYYREKNSQPCEACILLQFVPQELRHGKLACRHIPLNTGGDTLDLLYRFAYEPEIETAVHAWLVSNIQRLEVECHSCGRCEKGIHCTDSNVERTDDDRPRSV